MRIAQGVPEGGDFPGVRAASVLEWTHELATVIDAFQTLELMSENDVRAFCERRLAASEFTATLDVD